MQNIMYSRVKLGMLAVPVAAIAAYFGKIFFLEPSGSFISLLIAIAFGYLLVTISMAMLRDTPVLAFDEHGLRIKKLLRNERVDWRQVHTMGIKSYTIRRGFIPIWSQRFLTIATTDDTFRLSLLSLDLPGGGVPHLLTMLETARGRAVAGHDAAASPRNTSRDLGGADGFDRHLAAKAGFAAPSAPAPAAALRGFGRKIA